MTIIFYLPVNTDKPKFNFFLVFVCTTTSFIAQISSSELSELFRVITGANKNARKLLFTDLVNTNKQYVRRALILLVYQVSLRMCQVTKSFRQRGDSRIYPSHWKILRWVESGCQQMRLLPLFTRRLGAPFCGKYTEVENFFYRATKPNCEKLTF